MADTALEVMAQHIGRHADLTEDDRAALKQLPFTTKSAKAGTYLIREGTLAQHHVVLVSGFTQRNKVEQFGGRQIVAIQIPGEAISCSTLFFDVADHSTQALTAIETILIPRGIFRTLVLSRPAIAEAFLKMTLIEASISNEWLLNMGRRPAKVRTAHLLCEFAARLDAAGLSDGFSYEMPFTQEQLGDALSLTGIHVNRMLRELGDDGLIQREGRILRFPNRKNMERLADFSRGYLHLEPEQSMPDEADARILFRTADQFPRRHTL